MTNHKANAWLVNTGWTGGKYGQGKRMSLKHTRAIIDAIHSGELETAPTKAMDIFGLHIPTKCTGVPSEILNPIDTWANKDEYKKTLALLAKGFQDNFKKYEDKASSKIKGAGPKL